MPLQLAWETRRKFGSRSHPKHKPTLRGCFKSIVNNSNDLGVKRALLSPGSGFPWMMFFFFLLCSSLSLPLMPLRSHHHLSRPAPVTIPQHWLCSGMGANYSMIWRSVPGQCQPHRGWQTDSAPAPTPLVTVSSPSCHHRDVLVLERSSRSQEFQFCLGVDVGSDPDQPPVLRTRAGSSSFASGRTNISRNLYLGVV